MFNLNTTLDELKSIYEGKKLTDLMLTDICDLQRIRRQNGLYSESNYIDKFIGDVITQAYIYGTNA